LSPGQPTAGRADRILDAAGELLLRHGYRKVTIDDIAARAKVGKGTVYLHWRTKQQLFEMVLRRAAVGLVEDMIASMRADPAEARPHRLVRRSYLGTMSSPLLVALITGDNDVLGGAGDTALRGKELLAGDEHYATMIKYGLLRDDIPHLTYAYQAVSIGFWMFDRPSPAEPALSLEERADAYARVIRDAFEPSTPPDPGALAAAANEICAMFEATLTTFHQSMRQGESPPG
jgi:AcrR family transcriptional regulator